VEVLVERDGELAEDDRSSIHSGNESALELGKRTTTSSLGALVSVIDEREGDGSDSPR
jgi:hypothetical protein